MACLSTKQNLFLVLLIQLVIVTLYLQMERLVYTVSGIKVYDRYFSGNNSITSQELDVHEEDYYYGHTWEGLGHNLSAVIIPNSVAIGMGITSHKSQWADLNQIKATFPFFHNFLPSFCSSASNGYKYNFFLAFDQKDKFFTDKNNLQTFRKLFMEYITKCPKNSTYDVHFVHCSHNGQPARAQNDAMIEAYMANMEYMYRVNDDSVLVTPGWTEVFIATLKAYTPPDVGVVGPNHVGGNIGILTYDFVNYRHVEIHGFYYPRVFTGWYADDWVTCVYRPDKSTKHPSIKLTHTMERATRYSVDMSLHKYLQSMIQDGKRLVQRFIARYDAKIDKKSTKVVSMSLVGKDPRSTYGAIRNAQLLPVYFPGWALRIYVPENATTEQQVPLPVLNKLRLLGATLLRSRNTDDPWMWKYSVIHAKNVTEFVIMDPLNRVNDRLYNIIQDFDKNKQACFTVRDFKSQVNLFPLGILGGKTIESQKLLGASVHEIVTEQKNATKSLTEEEFIKTVLVPKVKADVLVYDSVTVKADCDKDPTCKVYPAPGKHIIDAAVGTRYDNSDNVI